MRAALRQQLADDWRALRARAALGELAVDLGHDIGSRQWWYGAVGCTGLIAMALALGSRVEPIRTIAPPALTPAQHDLARINAIGPLARGGVTGAVPRANPRMLAPLAEAPERPRLELSAEVGGAGFAAALRRSGVSASDMGAVNSLLRGVADTGRLARGTDIDLVLGRRESRSVPRPLDRLAFRAAFDLRVELTRVDGALTLKRVPIAVDSTPLRVTGSVGGNLQRALRSAGIPARLVGDFTRIMGYVVDFQRGVGKADRFDIIVEQDRAETGEVRHGSLLFASLARRGKAPIEVGRLMQGGHAEYFKSDGEGARRGLMKTPVDGARLTSGFGMRFHPLLSYSRMHQGVDFGAPHGAPIMAAASGNVSFAGRHGGHGNYIQLRHTKELVTAYAHLSRFAVKNGQRVVQGQVIGYVGSTGMSTGPHLHYEVWLRGRPANPVSLKFIGGSQLTGRALNQFMAQMNRWRAVPATGSAPAATRIASGFAPDSANAADKRRGRA
ncbi:M23 family metallopeptidase [Sandarakinorhabdus sp.]|uniref:M23 family metallopeptidase n=1 Tax=Sandarakinorhabdus sp. TaxID=1916663 RepID=UPI00286DDB91|nr:M23 family metallopeptidase [Sandarakinorhabdus sp.]